MLAKLIAESRPLTISKIAIGSGYTDESTEDFTNLISEKMRKDIESISYNSGVSMVRATFSNESLESGFHVREIGIFAVDPDEDSIVLYAYDNAGNGECDYLQEGSNTIVNIVVEEAVSFGNVESVQLTVNPQMAFATMEQFNQLNETKVDKTSIGNLQDLSTTEKNSLVNAINEVFTLGNEKKEALVTNLIAMGVTCNSSESWESLLAKVLTIFTGTDVSDTTAIASHVLETDYFYTASGVKTQGTMVDRSCVNGNEFDILNPSYPRQTIHEYTVSAPQYGTWGSNEDKEGLIVPAPSGYFNNVDGGDLSYVYVPASSLRSRLGITADKILAGNTICGVEGSASVGKKFASGCFTINNSTEESSKNKIWNAFDLKTQENCSLSACYITLNLDFVPSAILVYPISKLNGFVDSNTIMFKGIKMGYNTTIGRPALYSMNITFGNTMEIPYGFLGKYNTPYNVEWYAWE